MPRFIKTHKIRLKPTEQQRKLLIRACAVSRNAYNFGVALLIDEYEMQRELYKFGIPYKQGLTHHLKIKKLYNKEKPDWVRTKNGTASQEAFEDLGKAVSKFYQVRKNGERGYRKNGLPNGFPRFRNYRQHNSFRCTYTVLKVEGKLIRYSVECGPIKMCEEFRFQIDKFMNATFSFDGQYWHASISGIVDSNAPVHSNKGNAVGVDLGVKYLATISDDRMPYENPKAFYKFQSKLRRLQRKLDRMRRLNNPDNYNEDKTSIKGKNVWVVSNRMKKIEDQILKLHKRISNIRLNASHQLTAELTDEYGIICLEDLNVKGMMKNRRLAKAISDSAFYEKRRQFEYKSREKGGCVSVIDRWFPSSKLCHNCGDKNLNLHLGIRRWICENCGNENERDLNAAFNIKNEGLRLLDES